jgi:hypothetical protein
VVKREGEAAGRGGFDLDLIIYLAVAQVLHPTLLLLSVGRVWWKSFSSSAGFQCPRYYYSLPVARFSARATTN